MNMSTDTTNINVNSRVKTPSIFTIQEWLLSPSKGITLARSHNLIHLCQSNYTTEAHGSIFLIEVTPEIWRPKVKNKYTPPYYAVDIDDGVLDFDFYCKTVPPPK